MTTVYILKIKQTQEEKAFTSIMALCNFYDKSQIKVSRGHLSRVFHIHSCYENRVVKIKKFHALSTGDIKLNVI